MQAYDVEPQLQWLVDRDLIRELSHRYALAIDSRDLDGLVDLFVDDYEVVDGRRGKTALRNWFRMILSSYTTSIHMMGNHIISFDPDNADRATGMVYCRCELEVGPQWIVSCLLYRDSVPTGWLRLAVPEARHARVVRDRRARAADRAEQGALESDERDRHPDLADGTR